MRKGLCESIPTILETIRRKSKEKARLRYNRSEFWTSDLSLPYPLSNIVFLQRRPPCLIELPRSEVSTSVNPYQLSSKANMPGDPQAIAHIVMVNHKLQTHDIGGRGKAMRKLEASPRWP
jgi:hypothetical protein